MSSDASEPGKPARPYVWAVYAGSPKDASGNDPQAERRAAIIDGLTLLGILVAASRDVAATSAESPGLRDAAAVLIFWSKEADLPFTQAIADQVHDRAVVAQLDDVRPLDRHPQPLTQQPRPPRSSIPTVDMARWDGDRDDQLLLALAYLLHAKMYQSASGASLSENAYQVLARSSARLREPPAHEPDTGAEWPLSPTDVLLEALAYQPAQGGVGTELVRVLAQRQGVPADELLDRVAPGLRQAPDLRWMLEGTPPDELLALAGRCAVTVTGRAEVHLRHLLAAALLSDSPPVDDGVLAGLGTSAAELPDALLGVLRVTRTRDSIAAWEQLLAVSLAGGFDRDLVDPTEAISRDRDDLGYGVWAAMLASVIAEEATPMPVSIGLFGEWGAGKSTFMGLLRGEIATLCGRSGYVRDVVSIGFNAWHYADANLWASLGDEIFRALADALKPAGEREPSVQQKALLAKITEQRGAADDARARREQAEHAAKVQGERLATQLREARKDRQVHARDLASALFDSPGVRAVAQREAGRAWQLLGISDDVERGEMIAGQLDGVRQDRRALRSMLGWRMTWALTVVCLAGVLLTLAAHVFSGGWAAWLGGTGAWLRHYGGFSTLAAVLASGAALAGRLCTGLAALNSAAGLAEERAGKQADAKIAAARDRLRAAQARERAADAEFERLNADLADLERQLAGLAPGRRMYTFLAERAASGDYTGQLGLVSVIRKDLEHLVTVLHEHHRQLDRHAETAEPGQPAPSVPRRIDRIVLYIDDLDRCPPRQVVEVLQAVHLLLALDLFVVVVGVDPRWLVRALHRQYPGILNADGATAVHGNAARFAGAGEIGEALPADYLEKIFNIPFTLPAFHGHRLEQLIRRLASGPGPGAGTSATAADREAPPGPTASSPDVRGDNRKDAAARDRVRADPDTAPYAADAGRGIGAATGGTATDETGAAPAISAEPGSQVAVIQAAGPGAVSTRPGQDAVATPQRLSEDELRFLGALGPFVKTPRDAKRLFNVYRMLRATRDLSPASTFLGGEFQAVAMLLAMLTQDAHVFAQAVDAPAVPGSGVTGGLAWTEPGYRNWAEFAAGLTPERLTPEHGAGHGDSWRNRVIGEIPAADLAAWSGMARAVQATRPLVTVPDLTAFRVWVPHVRRFSYLPLTPAGPQPGSVRWPDGPPSGARGPGETAEPVRDQRL